MEKIINQIDNWKFLSELPRHSGGFVLSVEPARGLTWHRIFTYKNDLTRRSFSVIYDKSTKEYLARVVVGLTEFCDINYITNDLEKLENLLSKRLENTLYLLDNSTESNLESGFFKKGIMGWTHAEKLPAHAAGFERFISPSSPVRVINGSYIIIDYSDFEAESGLIICYNIFRDEFFGELRKRRMPVRTAAFDTKLLPELEDKLKSGLKPTLEAIRAEI